MNYKKFLLVSSVFVFLPTLAMAQFFGNPPSPVGGDLLTFIANIAIIILNVLWIVAVTFVIIMFVLAGFKYFTAQGKMEQIAEANRAIVWGVAGIVVILLAWSILFAVRVQIGV